MFKAERHISQTTMILRHALDPKTVAGLVVLAVPLVKAFAYNRPGIGQRWFGWKIDILLPVLTTRNGRSLVQQQ